MSPTVMELLPLFHIIITLQNKNFTIICAQDMLQNNLMVMVKFC